MEGSNMATSQTAIHEIFDSLKPGDRFLKWPELQHRVPFGRTRAHQLVQEGKFPAPYKLSTRSSAWLESEIYAWMAQCVAEGKKGKVAPQSEAA
jgi:prophage regulatory protein